MSHKRRPPPPGLSAETTIRIDREGNFWADGERITHGRLLEKLPEWLDYDFDQARYVLQNEVNWGFITVEDTPFVITNLSGENGAVRVHLSDGTSEALDPRTLRIDADDIPYADVKGGRFPARFSSQAILQLLEYLSEEGESYRFVSGATNVPIPRVGPGEGGRPRRRDT